jgi:hypothetical protein
MRWTGEKGEWSGDALRPSSSQLQPLLAECLSTWKRFPPQPPWLARIPLGSRPATVEVVVVVEELVEEHRRWRLGSRPTIVELDVASRWRCGASPVEVSIAATGPAGRYLGDSSPLYSVDFE